MKRLSRQAALKARREHNRQLAREDRAHRCANRQCQQAFVAGQVTHQRLGDDRRYCSSECLDEANIQAAWEGR